MPERAKVGNCPFCWGAACWAHTLAATPVHYPLPRGTLIILVDVVPASSGLSLISLMTLTSWGVLEHIAFDRTCVFEVVA